MGLTQVISKDFRKEQIMARTKKLTAKEMDAQIGYGKEIDTKAILSKVKKPVKISEKKTGRKTKSVVELIGEKAEKIINAIEPKKTVTRVNIVPSSKGTGFEVWVAYRKEGYQRLIWEIHNAPFVCDALKLAEDYLNQIDLVQEVA
jgi:hypothetical protein